MKLRPPIPPRARPPARLLVLLAGAYTGEMAVDQIKDMGMKTVLIGHSERRGEFGLPTPAESNKLMATKLA